MLINQNNEIVYTLNQLTFKEQPTHVSPESQTHASPLNKALDSAATPG